MSHSIETHLDGECLCRVKLNDGSTRLVKTYIKVPCIYTPDWQEDGGFMHDEGWADWDIQDAEVMYPDEFVIIEGDEEIEPDVDENLEIVELLDVISEDNLVIQL